MKIVKYLNKQMTAKLLQNKFNNWQKFIFFDLFSTKKFKIISNLIMLNRHNKIPEKKIYLFKKHKIQHKIYEFYLTQIGENYSHFYIFIPYIILILFGEKNKKYQKINLNLKESKNLIKKIKSLVPLLVPLFISAFRRANDLAMAMEARCYRGGAGRTKMKPLVYQGRDQGAYFILLAYFAVCIAIRLAPLPFLV